MWIFFMRFFAEHIAAGEYYKTKTTTKDELFPMKHEFRNQMVLYNRQIASWEIFYECSSNL